MDFDPLCRLLYFCGLLVVAVIVSDKSKTRKSLVGLKFRVFMLLKGTVNFVPISPRHCNKEDPPLGMLRVWQATCAFNLLSRRDVELEEGNKVNQDTAYFTVRGTSLGTASLTFTASTMGRGSATSEPKDIQVKH